MRKFGLIGKTLGHSFSKSFFQEYFKTNSVDAVYDNIELDSIDGVKSVFEKGYKGLNVTIPYKEAIIPYLDRLTKEAEEIGAVNVIQFKNGEAIGHNSDAYGFHQSIKPFLTNKHERALIFGSGGASKAVKYALRSIGVNIIGISRNPQNENEFSYSEVNENMIHACKLIVNCTPVGMYPYIDDTISIPFNALSSDHLVVDLIYNPAKSKFLSLAEESGATILNGESMLKLQALKSWEIWNS